MVSNKRALASGLRLLAACLTLMLVSACRGAADDAPVSRYELRGTIVSFNKDQRQVVVAHEAVPGLMEAMTMPFTLKEPAAAYDAMKPGAQIHATLAVSGARSWLENPVITVAEPAPASSPAAASGSALSEPVAGAEIPDFALVNQDGKKIALRQYRGRALAVTFIYTRCPLPDYCPLLSTKFAEVNRALERDEGLSARARLLSVTVDPAYDTPKVLRSYGAGHTGNYSDEKFRTWEFATGGPDEIRRMANYFGLAYREEADQIVHSLRTVVVKPDGTLHKLYRGNEWGPDELLADLRALAGAGEVR
ncbi:MAG: SCO family protein [Acidobacteria bacterium]|nr:SCO family protein [Acidobacteriota bacterium]